MERFRWISHRELRVLVNDYSGLSGEALVAQVCDFRERILALGDERVYLLIRSDDAVNVHGRALAELAKNATLLRPRLVRTAVVGATPLQATVIDSVNAISGLGARAFDSEREALDWLTE